VSEEDRNNFKTYMVKEKDFTDLIIKDKEDNYYYSAIYVNELQQEIERLIISLQAQEELTMNEHIKVERLNKQIEEYQKALDEYLDLKRKSYIEGFKWSGLEIIDQAKDFLQELKGSDKE
jgi:hypothetical protein